MKRERNGAGIDDVGWSRMIHYACHQVFTAMPTRSANKVCRRMSLNKHSISLTPLCRSGLNPRSSGNFNQFSSLIMSANTTIADEYVAGCLIVTYQSYGAVEKCLSTLLHPTPPRPDRRALIQSNAAPLPKPHAEICVLIIRVRRRNLVHCHII